MSRHRQSDHEERLDKLDSQQNHDETLNGATPLIVMDLAKRLLHWGPLAAMAITASVTVSALKLSSPWLTKNNSSIFGIFVVFIFLMTACCTLYNLWCAMLIGPGYLPPGWGSSSRNARRIIITSTQLWWPFCFSDKKNDRKLYEDHPVTEEERANMKFCQSCQGYKAHRAHHCRQCRRCVIKMDHHCPWINNCVGEMNHVYFIKFLFFGILTTLQSSTLLACGLYRAFYIRYYYLRKDDPHTLIHLTSISFFFTIFNLGLSAGVVVSVTGLLYQQMRGYLSDTTLIENLQNDSKIKR